MTIIDIQKVIVIEGDLPPKAQAMVIEWTEINKDKLLNIWNTQRVYRTSAFGVIMFYKFYKIKEVEPKPDMKLLIQFENGIFKIYNVKQLFEKFQKF